MSGAGTPLAGRHALVTGASHGIGLEIARALTGAGARVAMLARSAARLRDRAAELGAGALPIRCDVTDAAQVRSAAAAVREAFGDAPDIIVNNAGIFQPEPLEVMSIERFEETVRIGLVAPFLVLHEFLPRLRERASGHVVTIGSVADRTIYPENGAYSATKFGARAMHEVLRAETRGTGIRATLISPGPTDTPIWDAIEKAGTGRFPRREQMMPAAAVADAVLFALRAPRGVNVDELRLTPA